MLLSSLSHLILMYIFVASWGSVKPVLWNSQNRSHLLTQFSRCGPPTSVKSLNDDFWPSYYPRHWQDPWEPWVSWMCHLVTLSCQALYDSMNCRSPGFPVLHYLLEFAQTDVHWVDDAIQPSHPLSLSSLLAFNLSQNQGLFQWAFSSHQVAKVLELQLHHSNEYSGMISFRMDWLDLLAVQGTLRSLLQHHSSKASILGCSAFFRANSHICTWLLEIP